VSSKKGFESFKFRAVTGRCSCTVTLNKINSGGIPLRKDVGLIESSELTGGFRIEETSGTIIGESDSANHPENRVVVANGVFEALKGKDPATFAYYQAVGAGIKRSALA
jgi:hypothetical protein